MHLLYCWQYSITQCSLPQNVIKVRNFTSTVPIIKDHIVAASHLPVYLQHFDPPLHDSRTPATSHSAPGRSPDLRTVSPWAPAASDHQKQGEKHFVVCGFVWGYLIHSLATTKWKNLYILSFYSEIWQMWNNARTCHHFLHCWSDF